MSTRAHFSVRGSIVNLHVNSPWILTSCQRHWVASGQTHTTLNQTLKNLLYHHQGKKEKKKRTAILTVKESELTCFKMASSPTDLINPLTSIWPSRITYSGRPSEDRTQMPNMIFRSWLNTPGIELCPMPLRLNWAKVLINPRSQHADQSLDSNISPVPSSLCRCFLMQQPIYFYMCAHLLFNWFH